MAGKAKERAVGDVYRPTVKVLSLGAGPDANRPLAVEIAGQGRYRLESKTTQQDLEGYKAAMIRREQLVKLLRLMGVREPGLHNRKLRDLEDMVIKGRARA